MTDRPLVLVVDDDVTVRDVVTRYLDRAGYRVEVAGDGERALQSVTARRARRRRPRPDAAPARRPGGVPPAAPRLRFPCRS